MKEQEAIELGLRLSSRHIVPAELKDERELTIIQLMGDLYKAGYEVRQRFTLAMLEDLDIERMRREGVAY